MNRQDIYNKFCRIVAYKGFAVEASKVKPEDSLVSDLGMDSLDLLEVIMEVETRFKITIPDDDTPNLTTVQAIVDYLEKALDTSSDAKI